MADENTLLKVLENLNSEDLARFQKHLVQGVMDNLPAVPESELKDANLQKTVSKMVGIYGKKGAVNICETALRIMDHRLLAESLTGTKVPLWMTSPSTHVLKDVIAKKMSIIIPGHVKPDAKKFSIDVMKDDDIFFHFKPYFSDAGKGTEIVRNSLISGSWGSEEKETPSFPFQRGKPFLMQISCKKDKFKVLIDKTHLLDFKYRGFDFTKINKVVIRHDVITWKVRVEP